LKEPEKQKYASFWTVFNSPEKGRKLNTSHVM